MLIEIYTDGGCRGNQLEKNIGGYGVVLISGEHKKELKGFEKDTTNNRMELTAAIVGLKAIKASKRRRTIYLYSDSNYVVSGLNSWLDAWKKKGWKNSKKQTPENIDLWREMDPLRLMFPNLQVHHVKGHSGNRWNERADRLANEAMDEGA